MNQKYQNSESALSSSGRFGRLSYIGWNMLMSLSVVIIIGVAAAFSPELFTHPYVLTGSSMATAILIGIAYLVLFYFSFVFTIRRLHDRNHSGWLSILLLIPGVNLIFVFYLLFAKGDIRTNRYGPQRITKSWEKVLAWLYILIFPLAILAAIELPVYQDQVQDAQHAQIKIQQSAE